MKDIDRFDRWMFCKLLLSKETRTACLLTTERHHYECTDSLSVGPVREGEAVQCLKHL